MEESALLWPDTEKRSPDILLSIGTGQYRPSEVKTSPQGTRPLSGYRTLRKIIMERVESQLDAELSWKEFHENVDPQIRDRYSRVNPTTLTPLSSMDDRSHIDHFLGEIRSDLNTAHMRAKIRDVARRMIVSTFYLDEPIQTNDDDQNIMIEGILSICCSLDLTDPSRHDSMSICCSLQSCPRTW